jgi:hypothetical protein
MSRWIRVRLRVRLRAGSHFDEKDKPLGKG